MLMCERSKTFCEKFCLVVKVKNSVNPYVMIGHRLKGKARNLTFYIILVKNMFGVQSFN